MEQQEADKKMLAEVQQILATMDSQGQLKREAPSSGGGVLDLKISQTEGQAILILVFLVLVCAMYAVWRFQSTPTALPQPLPPGEYVRT